MIFMEIPVIRRARDAGDGPWPLFARIAGTAIPLSEEQQGAIAADAARALSWSNEDAKRFVEAYLRCEEIPETAGSALMGFLKEEVPWGGGSSPSDAPIPRICNLCARNLVETGFAFDAITTDQMQWSYMCVGCFLNHGCGLGNGWGQLFKASSAGEWLLVKGLPE